MQDLITPLAAIGGLLLLVIATKRPTTSDRSDVHPEAPEPQQPRASVAGALVAVLVGFALIAIGVALPNILS